MSYRRRHFLVAVSLLLSSSGWAQEAFPIGAWFPGVYNNDQAQWNARLQLVHDANFNTIHASQESRNPAATNQVWMAEAHRLGLNVQLYGWNVPLRWGNTHFWS